MSSRLSSVALKQIQSTVYYGTLVDTPTLGELRILVNARVGVDQDGTILYIQQGPLAGSVADEAAEMGLTDFQVVDISNSWSRFFVPGFIDTHIHAPQYPNCGVFGNSTLYDWLLKYTYPVELALTDPAKALDVYQKVVQMTLSSGTTCCAYYATLHVEPTKILADCAFEQGQRAFIGRTCQDCGKPHYSDKGLEDGQKSTKEVIDHIKMRDPDYSVIKPILAPRNANKVSREFMLWLAAESERQNLPIETHLSETADEVVDLLKMFPECDTYTGIYEKYNLLTERCILGHCVHLTEDELDLINSRKSGISHCPTSNSCLTSGEARVRWMLDHGSKVGLGTDVSGGFSPSILATARHAVLVSRHVSMKTKSDHDKLSVNDALYLATLGGARVVGMADQLGTFEAGKKWECQQIDLLQPCMHFFDFLNPTLEGLERGEPEELGKFQDLIDKWVFNGDDRNVRQVYVNGRCVVDKSVV